MRLGFSILAGGLVSLMSLRATLAQEAPPAAAPAAPPPADKPEKQARDKKPKVSGYVQVFFRQRLDHDGDGEVEPSLFRIHRVRLKVSGAVAPWLAYQVEIDPRAPSITGVLRDAFVDFRVIPHHRIRVGQQKTPWGYENMESSSRLYTVTRTELSEGPGRGVTLRDIGVALIGKIPLPGPFSLEDAIAVVNGAGMNVQADDTDGKNVWARVGARYRNKEAGLSVRLGFSLGIGDLAEPLDPGPPEVPAHVIEFKRFGADVQVDSPWFFLVAEVATSEDTIDTMPDEGGDSLACYGLVAGKTPWHAGPVLRYDVADLEEFARWTVGGYYGEPEARFRAMATFEAFEDEAGPHDHRLLFWTQVRF